jgi:carboxyl-terminal processing protease
MGLNMQGQSKWRLFLRLLLVVFLAVNLVLGSLVLVNYEEIARLLKVTTLIKTKALEPADSAAMFEGVLRGIVGSLDDPYSNYLSAKEYEDLIIHVQGSFGGLGILVGVRDNQLTVGAPPFKGTPAERAGLQVGDVIVQIDERRTEGMDLDTAIALMRGEPGTEIRLCIERKGENALIEKTLVREIINIPSVESQVLEQDKRIGYVRLYSFSGNTAQELNESLNNLLDQKVKGLIVDLRNNGGGDFSVCLEVVNHFVPRGPVVRVIGRDNQEDIYEADGGNLGLPLVVLVNDMTASASEIVAGAIKDTNSGTLVGTRTYGKGLVQGIYPLSGGGGVKLTTHKYLTPSGHDINQKGIEPNVVVDMPPNSQQDSQLAKGIEIIQTQL